MWRTVIPARRELSVLTAVLHDVGKSSYPVLIGCVCDRQPGISLTFGTS
jgi:hypothetical protein